MRCRERSRFLGDPGIRDTAEIHLNLIQQHGYSFIFQLEENVDLDRVQSLFSKNESLQKDLQTLKTELEDSQSEVIVFYFLYLCTFSLISSYISMH